MKNWNKSRLKKTIISATASSILMWMLAGLWHQVVMAQFYQGNKNGDHEGLGILLIAYFILGAIMALIYPIGYQGGRPIFEGIRFGMIMGILWVFPHELALAGAHGQELSYVFKNGIWHVVEQGFGGLVIGLIFGQLKANSPP